MSDETSDDMLAGEDFAYCATCDDYLARRREVVVPALLNRAADQHDEDPRPRFIRFMRGVHERHTGGVA